MWIPLPLLFFLFHHFPTSGVVLLVDVSLPLCPGEELIYLDPHTTQPAVEPGDSGCLPDESFHCQHPPCRMSIAELDPSIAVVCPVPPAPHHPRGTAGLPLLHRELAEAVLMGWVLCSALGFGDTGKAAPHGEWLAWQLNTIPHGAVSFSWV